MKSYKRVEVKDPDAGFKRIEEAIQNIPAVDSERVEEKIGELVEEIKKLSEGKQELAKASQEAYKASLEELVASIKSLTKTSQEALQKPSEPQQPIEFPEPVDVQALLEGVAKLMPAPVEAPPQVNVEAIVEKVFNLTNKKPSYTFKIERDFEGRLAGITAIPSEE